MLRLIDLERLSSSQMEDVQNEMKLSQLINHTHVARYLCSFVVGTKLWALQPLMHYGKAQAFVYKFLFLRHLSIEDTVLWLICSE